MGLATLELAISAMATEDSLIALTAREAVVQLNVGEVSPLELIDAVLARHEAVDGAVVRVTAMIAIVHDVQTHQDEGLGKGEGGDHAKCA